MAKNDINYNTLINAGFIVGGYFFVAKPILNKLGINKLTSRSIMNMMQFNMNKLKLTQLSLSKSYNLF